MELNTNSRSENDMLDSTQTSSMAPSESQVHTYQRQLSAKASDPLPSLKPMLSSKPFLSSQPLPSSASPYQLVSFSIAIFPNHPKFQHNCKD